VGGRSRVPRFQISNGFLFYRAGCNAPNSPDLEGAMVSATSERFDFEWVADNVWFAPSPRRGRLQVDTIFSLSECCGGNRDVPRCTLMRQCERIDVGLVLIQSKKYRDISDGGI